MSSRVKFDTNIDLENVAVTIEATVHPFERSGSYHEPDMPKHIENLRVILYLNNDQKVDISNLISNELRELLTEEAIEQSEGEGGRHGVNE